ncbi:crotonase/enoyl-CoA hydratase family protein [Aureimonas sp. AU40]|uniref:crotonase/enoyl-CoA hydratase family protein n=1 Tax=Aureimonas sp. AU40 TaxID=1637747 RepID=UPI0007862572|nr:crotonase/enoyl-CoA hydratase family protein [Aureimonas sp. AU40]
MNETTLIERQLADGVLTLRMNRPEKKNALNRAMYGALAEALEGANADEAVRAVLLLGGEGHFSSGNDIADFAGFDAKAGLAEVLRFLHALVDLEKPLVAGVDGLAVGIGTTVLFHCDLAYATPRSSFRTPFLDLGLVPEAGSSLLAPGLMGYQRAFALLVLGEALSAEEALAAGLLVSVGDDAETLALKAAARLATKPPEALRIARRLIRGDGAAVRVRIGEEATAFAERLVSAEARAAFAAFFDRRAH